MIFQRIVRTYANIRTLLAPLVGKLITQQLVDEMIHTSVEYYQQAQVASQWENLTYPEIMENCLEFWKCRKKLSPWTTFAHLCYLVQPSSATVERAFSILKSIYDNKQTKCLQSTAEGNLKIRLNRGSQMHS